MEGEAPVTQLSGCETNFDKIRKQTPCSVARQHYTGQLDKLDESH